MKDYLLDVVQHTHNLGFIELVKITGDDSTTTIEGIADDRSVILKGEFTSLYQSSWAHLVCLILQH